MALDLELALSELAHTPPVGDDSFPADGMTATVRRMATHVRRRRAAKHAGTSIVGVAAVAAIAIGGSAIKSHVDAAGGPSTALSCLLYTSPSPRDRQKSRMPSSA